MLPFQSGTGMLAVESHTLVAEHMPALHRSGCRWNLCVLPMVALLAIASVGSAQSAETPQGQLSVSDSAPVLRRRAVVR